MAEIRFVQTSFWGDSFILDLTPEEKLIYLYLFTNSKTTQCGAYEIPPKTISYETGLIPEVVTRVLERFHLAGKILLDKTTNEIFLMNWFRHNNPGAPTVKIKAVKDAMIIRSKTISEKVKEHLIKNGYCTLETFPGEKAVFSDTPLGMDTQSIPNALPIDTQSIPNRYPKKENQNETRSQNIDVENSTPEPSRLPMDTQSIPNALPIDTQSIPTPLPIDRESIKGKGIDKGNGMGIGNEDIAASDFSEYEKSSPPPSPEDNPIAPDLKKPHERIKVDKETFRFTGIIPEDLDRWEKTYPAVDISYQLGKMELWIASNPSQFKSNWFRFINNWLAREQERGGSRLREQEQSPQRQKTFTQLRTEQTSEAGKAALDEIFMKGGSL